MQFSAVVTSLFRRLPPRARECIKVFLGAGGHTGNIVNRWRARQLSSWKHPDVLLPIIEQIVQATGRTTLDGARVMEYGSGFLLAEPLIYSMFGAEEVHAVDYLPLLQPDAFRAYAVDVNLARVAEQLVARRGRDTIDGWLLRLREALQERDDEWFRRIGIRYAAPFDLLKDEPPARNFDLIVSRSTLEHVPAELAQDIVTRLAAIVKPGGTMFHYIHLADHRDIENAPFEFLSANDDYAPTQHDLRGNRMRASDWRNIFATLKNFSWTETTSNGDAALLPRNLAETFRTYARDDLMVNHFTICGRRVDP